MHNHLSQHPDGLPVWVRAPKRGLERFSGLFRAKLYKLAAEQKVKTASIREPGKVRGCRLFFLPSILFLSGTIASVLKRNAPATAFGLALLLPPVGRPLADARIGVVLV